jgi:hypothetical protein
MPAQAGDIGLADARNWTGGSMQLTFDSTEPLEQVLGVIGALYGVEVAVASAAGPSGAGHAEMAQTVGANTKAGSGDAPGAVAADNTTPRRAPRTRTSTSSAPAGGRGRRRASAATAGPSVVRAWARENGYQVSGHGRIPAAVVSAFEAQTG